MTAYTLETLIKGPAHENWIQPNESVNSEALCCKMYHLDAETQAGQVVAPCPDPALWAVSQLLTEPSVNISTAPT